MPDIAVDANPVARKAVTGTELYAREVCRRLPGLAPDLDWRLYASRPAHQLGGADLYKADLRGAELLGADLRQADLHGADLFGANLRRVDLRQANLSGADLNYANLHGVGLSNADLTQSLGWLEGRPSDREAVRFGQVG